MRAGREGSRERGRGKEEQRRAVLEDKFQVDDYEDDDDDGNERKKGRRAILEDKFQVDELIMNDDESSCMMVICDLIKIMRCLFS